MKIDDITLNNLFDMAKRASNNAHSPYSGFQIGAAVYTANKNIFTGCNVENASYGATICAERVAITKAVSENDKNIIAIAIYVQSDQVFPPCGICRQFMSEFAEDLVIYYGNDNEVHKSSLKDLYPCGFSILNPSRSH